MTKPSLDESLIPLVWEEVAPHVLWARTPLGDGYQILYGFCSSVLLMCPNEDIVRECDSIEAAKLAASRHFAGVVRSAFKGGVFSDE